LQVSLLFFCTTLCLKKILYFGVKNLSYAQAKNTWLGIGLETKKLAPPTASLSEKAAPRGCGSCFFQVIEIFFTYAPASSKRFT
jgi:hypothetical protein